MNTKPETKPRPHAALIHAWADGKTVQIRLKESQEEWKDLPDSGLPLFNDKHFEYRIKPEETSNEPWKPKKGEKYFYLDFIDGRVRVYYHAWDDDKIDDALYRHHNFFRTEKEAEDAIPRVEVTLKGVFETDTNVGSKSEIDGKPLSDGEKALIKALRKKKINKVFNESSSVLAAIIDDGHGGAVGIVRNYVAVVPSDDLQPISIVSAFKQIKAEQEASDEA